jgi:hypothetical protein
MCIQDNKDKKHSKQKRKLKKNFTISCNANNIHGQSAYTSVCASSTFFRACTHSNELSISHHKTAPRDPPYTYTRSTNHRSIDIPYSTNHQQPHFIPTLFLKIQPLQDTTNSYCILSTTKSDYLLPKE